MKFAHALTFVCFIFTTSQNCKSLSKNLDWVSNNLDLDKMSSYSSSHLDQTSLHMALWLVLPCRIRAELQIRLAKLTSIDSTCVISSPNPMFDHLLESSRWDDSNKWTNIGFGEDIGILENIKRSLSWYLIRVNIWFACWLHFINLKFSLKLCKCTFFSSKLLLI